MVSKESSIRFKVRSDDGNGVRIIIRARSKYLYRLLS